MTLTPFVILLATASAPVLDFASALAEARERSPALAEAAAELDAARAAVDEGSVLLPNPSLTGSLGTDAPFAGQGERRLGVALSQELPIFGTRGAALAAAEHELRAATARRRAMEVELSASVREALARVAAGQELVALRRELAEAGGRLAAAAARRAEAGNLSPAQANVAAVETASAQAELAGAAGEEREARAELCRLLGRSECGPFAVAWPDAASEPAPEQELLELALASRGDLAAEHAAERAAASRAGGAERARIPIPTLELGLERESSVLDSADLGGPPAAGLSGLTVRDTDTVLGLGLQLPLPLFTTGGPQAARARAEAAAAGARARALRAAVAGEVRAARSRLTAALEAERAWQGVGPRIEETLRWLAEGFEAGATSIELYLAQRDRLVRARVESLAARRALADAGAGLDRALGVPVLPPPTGARP